MSVIHIILPLALLLAGVFLGGFIWSVRTRQLDDVDTPPLRVLDPDD